ncbi:MAG TPA: xanthine dehydrogenase family protein subunit M [Anaerolineae bacterium]|nr:xanthine dehydrogenase family protein subunit M [Anaerolineae bacterium]
MLAPFAYFAPSSLAEASALLLANGPRARVLAGGTSLLVALERSQASADAVINLKRIPSLRDITYDSHAGLQIGALATLSELLRSAPIQKHYPVLIETMGFMATPQVQNLATIGGNLCQAAPAADLIVTLLALDATVRLYSSNGERSLSLDSFLPTWGGTILQPGEILTRIDIPLPRGKAHYDRFMIRSAADVPLANLAGVLEIENDLITHTRLVVGANGARPTRMLRAERALIGQRGDAACIEHAAELVVPDVYPPDDWRASREYRRALIATLTRRMLTRLVP